MVDLHGVEFEGVEGLLRLVAGIDRQAHAHAAQLLLDEGLDLVRPRLRQGDIHRQRQRLAVLDAVAVSVALTPPGLVEEAVGPVRVEVPGSRLVDIPHGALRQQTGGQRVVRGEELVDDLLPIDGGDERSPDVDIGKQVVAEPEVDAVVDSVRRLRIEAQPLFGDTRLIRCLDIADAVCLPGEHGSDAHGVFVVRQIIDAVEVGPALMLQVRGRPVVVLAGTDGELRADGLVSDVEGPAGVDLRGSARAEAFGIEVESRVREQSCVHRRRRLRETGGGGGEVEAHPMRVEDLAALIVRDLLGHRQRACFVAAAEEVEVLRHILRGQRRTVRVGHALTDGECVGCGIGVRLRQFGGQPRMKLEGLRILPQQTRGDVVHDPAVGVEADRRRVEQRPGLGFEVGEHSAADGFALGQGTGVVGSAGGEGEQSAETETEAQYRAAVEASVEASLSQTRGGGETVIRHGRGPSGKWDGTERAERDSSTICGHRGCRCRQAEAVSGMEPEVDVHAMSKAHPRNRRQSGA